MTDPGIEQRLKSLARMIGNTPMLAIQFTFRGRPRVLYAKAEHFNLTGSIKDRMALHILRRAHAEGLIAPGDTIAEATSGNTGISLAAVGRALGHPVTIFMPDWMSRERVDLIHALGATIVPVARAQGGFAASIRGGGTAAADARVPCPQFANAANIEARDHDLARDRGQLRRTAEPDASSPGSGPAAR
jgi:cysteine synthase A